MSIADIQFLCFFLNLLAVLSISVLNWNSIGLYIRMKGLPKHFSQHSKQTKRKLKLALTKIDFTNHNKHSIPDNGAKNLLMRIAVSVNVQVDTTSNIMMSM